MSTWLQGLDQPCRGHHAPGRLLAPVPAPATPSTSHPPPITLPSSPHPSWQCQSPTNLPHNLTVMVDPQHTPQTTPHSAPSTDLKAQGTGKRRADASDPYFTLMVDRRSKAGRATPTMSTTSTPRTSPSNLATALLGATNPQLQTTSLLMQQQEDTSKPLRPLPHTTETILGASHSLMVTHGLVWNLLTCIAFVELVQCIMAYR